MRRSAHLLSSFVVVLVGCSYPDAEFAEDAGPFPTDTLVTDSVLEGGPDAAKNDAADAAKDTGTDTDPGCVSPRVKCGIVCANLTSDPENCGTCGKSCSAGQACAAGICSCGTGKTTCSGGCADLSSDPANCGSCGHSCGAGACVSGSCTCTGSKLTCGSICVDPLIDPANCGACGTSCPTGKSCSAGVCCGPSGTSCSVDGECCSNSCNTTPGKCK